MLLTIAATASLRFANFRTCQIPPSTPARPPNNMTIFMSIFAFFAQKCGFPSPHHVPGTSFTRPCRKDPKRDRQKALNRLSIRLGN